MALTITQQRGVDFFKAGTKAIGIADLVLIIALVIIRGAAPGFALAETRGIANWSWMALSLLGTTFLAVVCVGGYAMKIYNTKTPPIVIENREVEAGEEGVPTVVVVDAQRVGEEGLGQVAEVIEPQVQNDQLAEENRRLLAENRQLKKQVTMLKDELARANQYEKKIAAEKVQLEETIEEQQLTINTLEMMDETRGTKIAKLKEVVSSLGRDPENPDVKVKKSRWILKTTKTEKPT